MRKIFFTTILTLVIAFGSMNFVSAQGMMGNNMVGGNDTVVQGDDGHTASGEAEGKAIWEKLSAKGGSASGGQTEKFNCENVSDDDFHALGMYFMGLMVGDSHEAMDTMMEQMMGAPNESLRDPTGQASGEDQMHIAIGKRMSGCEPDAPMPQSVTKGGMMQMMMNMMTGEWSFDSAQDRSSPVGFNSTNNMMNFGYGFGFFGWVFMVLWWVLIIIAIVALIKWLLRQFKGDGVAGKSALGILKERYAKGEINKQEFEEKKKDLS